MHCANRAGVAQLGHCLFFSWIRAAVAIQEYYNEYEKSYFGFTMKKGGWDCHRHYEILMSGSVPYFLDFHEMERARPPYTLPFLPYDLLAKLRELSGAWPPK